MGKRAAMIIGGMNTTALAASDLALATPVAVRLADWGVIRARGVDAAAFLNGQLTQETVKMDVGQARLAGYCSPKGRLLASFVMWRTAADEILLACSADLLATMRGTPDCTSSQFQTSGLCVIAHGGVASTGAAHSTRVAPAASARRIVVPPAVDDVAYGAAGIGCSTLSCSRPGNATPHSAISPDASVSLHLERITNMARRLSVGASRSALQASRISSAAVRHITKLASSRPLGEQ